MRKIYEIDGNNDVNCPSCSNGLDVATGAISVRDVLRYEEGWQYFALLKCDECKTKFRVEVSHDAFSQLVEWGLTR